MSEGKLIIIEGGDGCGKTEQAKRLVGWLQSHGLQASYVHVGRHAPASARIYDIVTDPGHELHPETKLWLYNAAERESSLVMQALLREGTWVVADRSWRSRVAYQGAGEGLDRDMVEASARPSSVVEADLCIILDVPVAVGRARVDGRGARDWFEQQSDDFHERIRDDYRRLARRDGLPSVAADRDIDAVTEDIRQLVLPLIP